MKQKSRKKKPAKRFEKTLLRKAVRPLQKQKKQSNVASPPFSKPKARKRIESVLIPPEPSAKKTQENAEGERPQELPDHYGDNQIFLMVRDPHWLYAYWEIQKEFEQACLNQLGGDWNFVKSVLRVYETANQANQPSFFDIPLSGFSRKWSIEVSPNRSYVIEIGLLHQDGRFIVLARSNRVTTPRIGMSDVIDEQWMDIDFEKMYALSGGFEVGKSSLELQKLMEERLVRAVSSGSGASAISSLTSPVKIHKRDFYFILDCELIIYGATESDAKVTLQGCEVKLQPDGTFSLRFAFPDGKQTLDVRAISADGIEERVIIPVVERTTQQHEPILKPEGRA